MLLPHIPLEQVGGGFFVFLIDSKLLGAKKVSVTA